ncbi:cyclic GMP-AMP synthase-like receptor isoform X2 [Haemaphysalis longicornis]
MTAGKKARAALEEIHEALCLDDETTARNKKTLNTLLKVLITCMIELDPLFDEIFNRHTYTGSSYEGLRIFEADEFDINIVLRLLVPIDKSQLTLADPGCVSLRLTRRSLDHLEKELGNQAFQQLKRWLDNGRLVAPRFRQWFQSVVDRAVESYKLEHSDNCDSPEVSVSGPAMTLHVTLANEEQFDVDLVPVFEWEDAQLPKGFRLPKWAHKYHSEEDKWVMVPKGNLENDYAWRMHFPTIERKLIKDMGGCAKPVIRLVKALKEKYQWNLSSYACKTVVMRHLLAKPRKSAWEHKHQFTRLLEVLNKMQAELLAGGPGISYLFDKRMSLIPRVNESTRRSIAGFLQNTVDWLDKAPETAPDIFLPPSADDSPLYIFSPQFKADISAIVQCLFFIFVLVIALEIRKESVSNLPG